MTCANCGTVPAPVEVTAKGEAGGVEKTVVINLCHECAWRIIPHVVNQMTTEVDQ
jgi:protein-arginine kinase activator protein McsA